MPMIHFDVRRRLTYASGAMSKLLHFRLIALTCVLACAGCATVQPRNDGIAYEVDIHGAGWKIGKAIKESAGIFKFEDQPPSTIGQLRYRMEKDLEIIETILEANGYYDASADLYLDPALDPVLVEITVRRGRQYRFGRVQVQYIGPHNESLRRIRPHIRKRQRVVAAKVFEEEERILEQIKHCGYPFPKLTRRLVEVNHEKRRVDLVMVFDPGAEALFGEVRVEGLETLKDTFIRRQLPWNAGDRFDAKALQDFERKLLATGLFSSVKAGVEALPAATNSIPVVIRLSERSKRTVRLGVNYSDVGPGAKGYWEHRNLFGGGEKLETSLSWNPIELNGTAEFTRSGFLDAHQYLVLRLDGARERTDAYEADKVASTAMVLRDLTSSLQGGLGLGYKHSQVLQLEQEERYDHVFFPLQGIFDTRNDQLNPVRGMQVFGRTAFYDDVLGSQSFLKTRLEGRNYLMLWERYRVSSALRLTLGSIDAAAVGAVPADERFYAGGGGSIRGYEYQKVGPQQAGEPIGGDKLVEFSMELRMQPGRRLGYAAFFDGGTVYNEELSDLDRSLNYGAGVGLRWFTGIGPLRADVAYPLNPSADQVERVQFYISLGQAF